MNFIPKEASRAGVNYMSWKVDQVIPYSPKQRRKIVRTIANVIVFEKIEKWTVNVIYICWPSILGNVACGENYSSKQVCSTSHWIERNRTGMILMINLGFRSENVPKHHFHENWGSWKILSRVNLELVLIICHDKLVWWILIAQRVDEKYFGPSLT